MSPLRLSLTIPGAVALGAYEGGALAALLVAAQSLGEDLLVIDSIGSASAGSVTAVVAAQTLLQAKDPVTMMYQAWVVQDSFDEMRERKPDYPLNSGALTKVAQTVLGLAAPTTVAGARAQQTPIKASMSLTSLAGLTYRLHDAGGGPGVAVSTFQDWYGATFDTQTRDWATPAQAALASGANAMGFPAKLLDRSADRAAYEAAGLEGFPDHGRIWYTDGGTTNNEPLGRTIDVAQEIASDDPRLYLLIHYDTGPTPPGDDSPWSGTNESPPSWVRSATRAMHAQSAQSIFDDLKRVQKTNSHVRWTGLVADALARGLSSASSELALDDAGRASLETAVRTSIAEVLTQVHAEQASLSPLAAASVSGAQRPPGAPASQDATGGSLEAALLGVIQTASGLRGREELTVDLVSPTIDPSDQQRCAGAFMFHFGGFFDIKLRHNDFALGYRNMSRWVNDTLPRRLGSTATDAHFQRVRDALERAPAEADPSVNVAPGAPPAPGLRDKWDVALFVKHIGGVILHDAIHGEL